MRRLVVGLILALFLAIPGQADVLPLDANVPPVDIGAGPLGLLPAPLTTTGPLLAELPPAVAEPIARIQAGHAIALHRPEIAQATIFQAAQDLQAALSVTGPIDFTLDAPPAMIIDLRHQDNTYTQGVHILIDAGGHDTYRNNAGGSNLASHAADPNRACIQIEANAALLIDLGGDDKYLDGRCGFAGGGYRGFGFLYDGAGNDRYDAGSSTVCYRPNTPLGAFGQGAGSCGVNGAGYHGIGFLYDAEGTDTYKAGDLGCNGGGYVLGSGLLWDAGNGDDTYHGGDGGCNGGGHVTGTGRLIDESGNDEYRAGRAGTNGGADGSASGLLVDGAGHDTYRAKDTGTNGGAFRGICTVCFPRAPGTGQLWDGGGSDTYTATHSGVNGQGVEAVGLLVDRGGDATIQDQHGGGDVPQRPGYVKIRGTAGVIWEPAV